jgi:CO/xanthine dehydrogenase Mo-binding subunit
VIGGSGQALRGQALSGQAIEFVDGVVQQSNFQDYPLARVPMTPEIEIASIREAGVMRAPVKPAVSSA